MRSAQSQIEPLPVAGGQGSYFWDYDGRRYLDFASQVVNISLEYAHPRVLRPIAEQAARLCAIGPAMASEPRSGLARLLSEVTPGDLGMTLFTTGGADANENAIKLARWFTGRQKIVARYRSYHGATAGAAALTGDPRRWAAEPGGAGRGAHVRPLPVPLSGRASLRRSRRPRVRLGRRPCRRLRHRRRQVRTSRILQYEGPQSVAAVILETVTGTNGVLVPPPGYLASIREICDRHGILLICDEVMTGFGRTGRWFAVDHWGVVPDLITLAKGLTGGAVPLGAMVVSEKLRPWLDENEFASGLTACGHPLACAAGVATVETMRDEGLVRTPPRWARSSRPSCRSSPTTTCRSARSAASACSGALELVRDRETREPLVPYAARGGRAADGGPQEGRHGPRPPRLHTRQRRHRRAATVIRRTSWPNRSGDAG